MTLGEKDKYISDNLMKLADSRNISTLTIGHQGSLLAALEAENAELKRQVKELQKGIVAVRELIDETSGVMGLHQNGEGARWDELLKGGGLEGWLIDFSIAEAIEGKHYGT